MKLKLYTIYDRVTEDSCPPMAVRNDGTAIRMYIQLLTETIKNDQSTDVKDYELYAVGEYDSERMTIHKWESQIKINIHQAQEGLEQLQYGKISIEQKQEEKNDNSSKNLE